MNAQAAVRQQLGMWHGVMDGVVADCTPEQVNKNIDGATITSIASVYAHTVFAEDFIVQMMVQGKPPIYEAQGWAKKLNVAPSGAPPSMNPDWGKAVKMDVPSFQQYAKDVYAASDAYLANASDAELERKVQTPIGEQTVGWAIANLLGTHAPQHASEIAALKGVQGLKGLPF